jgi:hypothetical protein
MGESDFNTAGPAFVQTFHGPVQNVYNVNGDLLLSPQSSTPDFQKTLQELKRQIDGLLELDPERRKELSADLDAAARETAREKPAKGVIVARLSTVQAMLEATKETVKGAWDVAKIVAQAAAWAAAFFA